MTLSSYRAFPVQQVPHDEGEQPPMNTIQIILYVAALVLLILAAVGVGGRIQCGWAGLACWLIAAAFVPMLT